MSTHFTSLQRQEVLNASGHSPIFDSSPYILQQSLLFPYNQGASLINAILLSGQWQAVSNAYSDPPISTEQVLHPEKYLEGERPVTVPLPDMPMALAKEWEVRYDDVMGEFFLKTYLETRIGTDLASRATAGWGGDRFNLMVSHQGEHALVVLSAWDSERDAKEFFDAMDSSDSVPDEGFLGLNGDRVLWVMSASSATTDDILSLFPEF